MTNGCSFDSLAYLITDLLSPHFAEGHIIRYHSINVLTSMTVGFCVQSLTNRHFRSLTNPYLRYIPWIMIPITAPLFAYGMWSIHRQKHRERNTVELHDENSISQLLRYMMTNESYYTFKQGAVIDQDGVCFQEITGSISFDDHEFDVKGEIMWKTCDSVPAEEDTVITKEKVTPKDASGKDTSGKDASKDTTVKDKPNDHHRLQFPVIVVNQIGSICHSAIEYVRHIICRESRVIGITGDQFATFRKYINLNKMYYVPEHVKLVGNDSQNQNIFFPPNKIISFQTTIQCQWINLMDIQRR